MATTLLFRRVLQLLWGASRLQLPFYAYIDERKRQGDVCVRAQDRATFYRLRKIEQKTKRRREEL